MLLNDAVDDQGRVIEAPIEEITVTGNMPWYLNGKFWALAGGLALFLILFPEPKPKQKQK